MRPCAQGKLPPHRSAREKPLVGPARSRRPFGAGTAPLYDARMGKEARTKPLPTRALDEQMKEVIEIWRHFAGKIRSELHADDE